MLIAYGTDAPIYHFPWMTLVLMVVNAICFAVTGMGMNSEGWLLTYGHGLHPTEWLAYNFLHFGFLHLIGNMFFLWAFGIVVEGKLGWWKFLAVYLGIGFLGGMLIQIAMLGHTSRDIFAMSERPSGHSWIWIENSVFAQEDLFPGIDPQGGPLAPAMNGQLDDDDLLDGVNPGQVNPGVQIQGQDLPMQFQDGAGGASLIIYGLMAIVLIWAPRNEIHCLFVGLRSGTFEIEYLYFCGFYIAIELFSAVFSVRGFEVTSEIGHLTGAIIGAGLGVLLVKQGWVDCENWDLFSVMAGKNSAAVNVGSWQDNYRVPHVGRGQYEATLTERAFQNDEPMISKKKKKAKLLPKLVELDSLDDDFDADDSQSTIDSSAGKTVISPDRSKPDRSGAFRTGNVTNPQTRPGVAELVASGEFKDAAREYLQRKSLNTSFQLHQDVLRQLADGLFKAKAINEAATFLEEFIRRFPDKSAEQRVKLSIVYIKYLRRPTAALKMLVKVDPKALGKDYQPIYAKAVTEAQRMIADGVTDSSE